MSLLRVLLLLALGGCVAGQPKNNLVDEAEVAERATALGVAYLQQGDLVRAKENLLKALSVDKRSARAHHTLAIVFQQEQEFDLAEDYFKRAIGLDESLTATRNNYGAFLYAMGRPQEAVLELIRATEDRFYELRPQAFENLGVAYLALEDRAKAREAFDRGLALNPRLPRALIELAVLEVAEQNFSAARQHYLAYQGLAGDSPKSLSVCVTVNTVFKAYGAAGQCRADLLRIYPASEEAIRLAAEAERGDR